MGCLRMRRGVQTARRWFAVAAICAVVGGAVAPAEAHEPEVNAGQPDVILFGGNGNNPIGDDVYNTTGAHQTKRRLREAGRYLNFMFGVQNDSDSRQTLRPRGCASTSDFRVRYYLPQGSLPSIEVTESLTNGQLALSINAHSFENYEVNIYVRDTTPVGATLTCRLRAAVRRDGADAVRDVGLIVVQRT